MDEAQARVRRHGRWRLTSAIVSDPSYWCREQAVLGHQDRYLFRCWIRNSFRHCCLALVSLVSFIVWNGDGIYKMDQLVGRCELQWPSPDPQLV
jgi:hypothetical protein